MWLHALQVLAVLAPPLQPGQCDWPEVWISLTGVNHVSHAMQFPSSGAGGQPQQGMTQQPSPRMARRCDFHSIRALGLGSPATLYAAPASQPPPRASSRFVHAPKTPYSAWYYELTACSIKVCPRRWKAAEICIALCTGV